MSSHKEKKMKNRLTDLNNHLFAEIERLGDEDLTGEGLTEEIRRASAIANVAGQIIAGGTLALNAAKVIDGAIDELKLPLLLEQ
jgi:adhesin HecA-like repeat protein